MKTTLQIVIYKKTKVGTKIKCQEAVIFPDFVIKNIKLKSLEKGIENTIKKVEVV